MEFRLGVIRCETYTVQKKTKRRVSTGSHWYFFPRDKGYEISNLAIDLSYKTVPIPHDHRCQI